MENTKRYVWLVFDGALGCKVIKAFDNEISARKFSMENATSFIGFEDKYLLPVEKVEIE